MIPFREHHLLQICDLYEQRSTPLDLLLKNYFRTHHAVGSKDRKFICDTLYGILRWQALLDHLNAPCTDWESRYRRYLQTDPTDFLQDETIPPHIRVSFPKPFFDLLNTSLGESQAWEFCQISNETAPTTVRVNLLKTTRAALLKEWEPQFAVCPTLHSPVGITFQKKENFFAMPRFKEGYFEVQDEGSQLIADLITPKGKEKVLDFCAGSGGKTLAFAPKTQGKGQIFLHDIRPFVLAEAKKRLKRAGIQNAQVLLPDSPHKRGLKGNIDWVLVDAPCSGTGTLRRNPDMKWKFTSAMVERLVEEQRAIFEEALSFLTPSGKIVYATCSVLPQENEEQIAFFQEHHRLQLVQPPFKSFPQSRGMDGFFGAILKR